jgi:hypothetical protein
MREVMNGVRLGIHCGGMGKAAADA